MPAAPPFARIVRYHRRRAGLSQAALARLAGVGKTVVFDVEAGKASVRLTTLLRILGALNIRLDWDSPLRAAFDHSADSAADSVADGASDDAAARRPEEAP